MPPNTSGSEDLVETRAPESEDQVLTDEEVASADGGIGVTRTQQSQYFEWVVTSWVFVG
jgi:hypothetical protein